MRVLHVLSQRPSLTGSGVTLDALVRCAADAGWDQAVVVGTPIDDPRPCVVELAAARVFPVVFGGDAIPFPVPGMSDVMPYPSTRFGAMTGAQLATYRRAWRNHLAATVRRVDPQVIHTHHVWLVSSMVKDVAADIPVVTQCHATGLRQMSLVPELASEVRRGCARNDAFVVLHRGHADVLSRVLDVPPERVRVVGAGYRDELFTPGGRSEDRRGALLYVGKYSAAKGLPWLLDAVDAVARRRPETRLHVAGDGAGDEAEALRARMAAMHPLVVLHGQLPHAELADLMRRSAVCVLPSFFEGVPLVLVEALACGCRLVATDLPGVARELAPRLGSALDTVELPAMETIDRPRPDGLPAFVHRLETAIERALDAPPVGDRRAALQPFTWPAVFNRVERAWRSVIEARAGSR